MRLAMFAIGSAAAVFMTGHAIADLAYRCQAPKGQTVLYGNLYDLAGSPIQSTSDGALWDADGFANTKPLFVWRQDDPQKLFVSWGDTIPDELRGKVPGQTSFREAAVVYKDGDQIQAVERRCGTVSCSSYLITLFPGLEFMTAADTGFSTYWGRPEKALPRPVFSLLSAKG